jgi:hypothetical protein
MDIESAYNLCAYCGQKVLMGPCQCKYRFSRMGGYAIQVSSTARNNTIAQMREEFESMLRHRDPAKNVAWCLSMTELNANKLEKADAKRLAERKAKEQA